MKKRLFLLIVVLAAVALLQQSRSHAQDSVRSVITSENAAQVNPVAVLEHEPFTVFMAFDANSQWLLTDDFDAGSTLWNVETWQPDPHDLATARGFTFDGTGLFDQSVSDITLESLQSTGDTASRFATPDETIRSVAVSQHYLAASTQSDFLHVWALDSGDELAVLPVDDDEAVHLMFDPTETVLLYAPQHGDVIRLWEIGDANQQQRVVQGQMPAAFSPNGMLLAHVDRSNTVTIRSVLQILNEQPESVVTTLEGHFGPINDLAFSPDGAVVASASNDGTVSLWNPLNGDELHILTGHTQAVHGIAFHPTEPLLASASGDGTVRLWNSETGEALAILDAKDGWMGNVLFSPDGSLLAAHGGHQYIYIWGMGAAADLPEIEVIEAASEAPLFATEGVTGTALSDLSANQGSCTIKTGEQVQAIGQAADGAVLLYAGGGSCEGMVWVEDAQFAWKTSLTLPIVARQTTAPLLRITNYEEICANAGGQTRLNTQAALTAYPPTYLPPTLQSTLATGINVVICHEYPQVTIENCHKIGRGNYSYIYIRKRVDQIVTLVDYASGQVVAQQRFNGGEPPPCPTRAVRGEGLSDPPPVQEWVSWVLGVLYDNPNAASRTVVATETLNVRAAPNTRGEIITTLPHNTPVNLIARNAAGDWVLALLPDMSQGWLFTDYLTLAIQTDITALPVLEQ